MQADDGSVLHGMAAALRAYWAHCYGPDGRGGAMASLAATAQVLLHQLSCVPCTNHRQLVFWEVSE